MSISNWNGSHRCTPAKVVSPYSLPELVTIVRDPSYPSPVRAIGELHSLNESIKTDGELQSLNGSIKTEGTVVFMKHFDKMGEPDLESCTVTVGAGVRMIDLKNALKKHGMQLPVVPEIGNATAGSVACCGTKDSSLGPEGPEGRGQISSTVVAVRLVNAQGQKVLVVHPTMADRMVSAEEDEVRVVDAEELRLIRSSYGLLGIIYEVTFQIERRQRVWYEYERIKLDHWLKAGAPLPEPASQKILGGAHGFLGFLLPYRRELIVERRRKVLDRARVILVWTNLVDRIKLKMRTIAWTTGARPFNAPLRRMPLRMRRKMIAFWIRRLDRGLLTFFFLGMVSRFASYRADAMIDFKRPVSSYFDFTFWAFPVSTWGKVVPAYLEFCERFRRERDFRPALPTEVYFIRRDESALLSFSLDEDIYTLDMVNWSDEEPAGWKAMNLAFNEFAAEHGGRPLLNQTKWLQAEVAPKLWKQGWYVLARERRERDPQGRFLTPFLGRLLP